MRLRWEWLDRGHRGSLLLLYVLVRWKNRFMVRRTLVPPYTVLAPILK